MRSHDFVTEVNQALLDITKRSRLDVWSRDDRSGGVVARFGDGDQFEVTIEPAGSEMTFSEDGQEFIRVPAWGSLLDAARSSGCRLDEQSHRLLKALNREAERSNPLSRAMQALEHELALEGINRR